MNTSSSFNPSDNGPEKISNSDRNAGTNKSVYDEAKNTARKAGKILREELSHLKNDLETLLSRAPSLSDAELSDEHAHLMAKFGSVKSAVKGIASGAGQQLSHGIDRTSGYVKEKPMQSVAMAVGLGLLAGMLFRRR